MDLKIGIETPALLLLQQLNSALYPESQVHIMVVSLEQWTSRIKNKKQTAVKNLSQLSMSTSEVNS